MQGTETHLNEILDGCRRGKRLSQQRLYEQFHGYALHLCLRYAANREEAVEVMNDAFFKVLTRLDQYDPALPFKPWLRQILVRTAIDYFRKNHRQPLFVELMPVHDTAAEDMPLLEIQPGEDLLPLLQRLTPAYRTVFNLYVMEGYAHDEIAGMLGISASASRSNLARATERLRQWLGKERAGNGSWGIRELRN
jgi:RNA polymerase sigma-70 factor (ECF subfamily)